MRRDRLDILKDILITCNSGKARKTEITYRSNLNFKKTTDYISWLVVHGLRSSRNYIIVRGHNNKICGINRNR